MTPLMEYYMTHRDCDCETHDCDKCHTCFGKDCDHSDDEYI